MGGMLVEKCKFLQESGCKGLCLHQVSAKLSLVHSRTLTHSLPLSLSHTHILTIFCTNTLNTRPSTSTPSLLVVQVACAAVLWWTVRPSSHGFSELRDAGVSMELGRSPPAARTRPFIPRWLLTRVSNKRPKSSLWDVCCSVKLVCLIQGLVIIARCFKWLYPTVVLLKLSKIGVVRSLHII